MSLNVTVGATLTGGSTVALAPAGIAPGKSTYVTPTHSRVKVESVEFTLSGSGTGPNPVVRTGVKITFANRTVEEGCCTVQEGSVIFDGGFRWALNQPVEVAEDVIDLVRGVVFTDAFRDAILKGILPNG